MISKKLKQQIALAVCITLLAFAPLAVRAWIDFTQSHTNNFQGKVSTVTVILHKYEKNADGEATTILIKDAEFILLKEVAKDDWEQIGGVYFTNGAGQIRVEGLAVGEYKFVEISPSYGYKYDRDTDNNDITEYFFSIDEVEDFDKEFKDVIAYNRRLYGSLEISKTVIHSASSSGSIDDPDEPAEFEFTVFFSDDGTYEYYISGGTKETITSGEKLYLADGEIAIFDNLPVGIYYLVVETKRSDYATTSTGNTGNIQAGVVSRADFINTKINVFVYDGECEVTVKKIVAGEVPESDKDRDFSFYIDINGTTTPFVLKDGASKTFLLNCGDTYSVWEDDPLKYSYAQSTVVNGMGTASPPAVIVSYTNTYIDPTTTHITGEKTWDITATASASLPSSIKVQLLREGVIQQIITVVPDEDGKWLYSFNNLRKYDDNGNEIVYTVQEVPIPGFTGTVVGYNITNVAVNPVIFDPPVSKIITGEVPDELDAFSFKLQPLNGAPMPENTTSLEKSIIGAGWVKFGEINFTSPGTYTYKITEVKGKAKNVVYDSTIFTMVITIEEINGVLAMTSKKFLDTDGSEVDEMVFNNEYSTSEDPTPPPEKKKEEKEEDPEEHTISGQVFWEHGDNHVDYHPEEVLIQIKNGDEVVHQFTVTKDDDWQWSKNVPKYDKDGKEIKYTVDQKNLPSYTYEVDGYHVTNTYVSVDYPGDNPETGVKNYTPVWFALALLSLVGLFFNGKKKKKKKH